MYMEATGGQPGWRARMILPEIPWNGDEKCLSFRLNLVGYYQGSLYVRDQDGVILWKKIGRSSSDPNNQVSWVTYSVTLHSNMSFVVLEGYRGGNSYDDDVGDVALDDLRIDSNSCKNIILFIEIEKLY